MSSFERPKSNPRITDCLFISKVLVTSHCLASRNFTSDENSRVERPGIMVTENPVSMLRSLFTSWTCSSMKFSSTWMRLLPSEFFPLKVIMPKTTALSIMASMAEEPACSSVSSPPERIFENLRLPKSSVPDFSLIRKEMAKSFSLVKYFPRAKSRVFEKNVALETRVRRDKSAELATQR